MSKIITSAVAAVLLAGTSMISAADTAEETRDVSAFSSVSMKGFLDVSVTVGPEQSVRVVADDDIIDRVITEVRGDTLVIDMEKGRYRNIDKLHVYVTVPTLESADLAGSGDMEIEGLNNQDFDASLRGSGDIILKAETLLNVSLDLRGSGDIEARGRCKTVDIGLRGSGDIEVERLKCAEAEVDLQGSGDVEVFASERAKVLLRGSGNVDVYGDPDKVSSQVRGSGEVSVK